MKVIPVLVATAAVVAAGCAQIPSDTYKVYIDPNFTTMQQESILIALQEWQDAVASYDGGVALTLTPVIAPFEECGSVECEHVITIRWDTMAQLDASVDADALGTTSRYSAGDWANIWAGVDGNDADPTTFHTMILHELGHGMGLHHTGPGTLMYYEMGPNDPGYVTCLDVGQWANVRGTELPNVCHQVGDAPAK